MSWINVHGGSLTFTHIIHTRTQLIIAHPGKYSTRESGILRGRELTTILSIDNNLLSKHYFKDVKCAVCHLGDKQLK